MSENTTPNLASTQNRHVAEEQTQLSSIYQSMFYVHLRVFGRIFPLALFERPITSRAVLTVHLVRRRCDILLLASKTSDQASTQIVPLVAKRHVYARREF